jgi:DNA-binding IclR family transcriptional regulator
MAVGRHGGPGGLGLVEIATHAGLHKSTTHRLVAALSRQGFLQQDPDTGRYRLGLSALEVGSLFLTNLTLRELAAPHLSRLMTETDESVHLCLLDEGEIVYIDRVESRGSAVIFTRIGIRQPAYCTAVGQAMLAFLPREEVSQVLARGMPRRTKNTITSPRKFTARLGAIRALGYSISMGQNREHINAVAAPIFDHKGRPIAGMVVSGLSQRLTPARLAEVGLLVKQAAEFVSRQMGYQAGDRAAE